MIRRRRGAVVAAIVGSLVVAGLATPAVEGARVSTLDAADAPNAAEQDLEARELQGDIDERRGLGFRADRDYVMQLRGSGAGGHGGSPALNRAGFSGGQGSAL